MPTRRGTKRHAPRFLKLWEASPQGTIPQKICEDMNLRPAAYRGWMRVPGFREKYLKLREHHAEGQARRDFRQANAFANATPEIREKLELFLERLQEQATRGRTNQAAICREIDLELRSVWRRRNPLHPTYDPDFADRYDSILAASTMAAEERAAWLATAPAGAVADEDDDPRMLAQLTNYLRCRPGAVLQDRRHLEVKGTVRVEHHHQLTAALIGVADRFQLSRGEQNVLEAEYEKVG